MRSWTSGSDAIARFAAFHSSVVIVSKSALKRRSRSENASVASSSIRSWSRAIDARFAPGNSASARRRFSGGLGPPARPSTRGSSIAIIRPRRSGSRQNRWNAWSNSGWCSGRSTRQAPSAACRSSRESRPASGSASSASATRSLPIGSPAARSTRAKWTTLRASRPDDAPMVTSRRPLTRPRPAARAAAAPPRCPASCAMSSWYFSSTPSVSSTTAGSSVDRIELEQRARPLDRLGDAGSLEQLDAAQPLHERDDLAREPRLDAGDASGARSRIRAPRRGSRPSGRGSGA